MKLWNKDIEKVNYIVSNVHRKFNPNKTSAEEKMVKQLIDDKKIKRIGEEGIMTQGEEAVAKGSIMGALTLYLDFINLFLMLLRFFGGSRD